MKFYIEDNPKIERVIDKGIEKYGVTGRFISREFTSLETASKVLYKLIKEGFEIKE